LFRLLGDIAYIVSVEVSREVIKTEIDNIIKSTILIIVFDYTCFVQPPHVVLNTRHYFASPKQAGDGTYYCPKYNVKSVSPGTDGIQDGGRCRKGHYFVEPTQLDGGAFACSACESTNIEPVTDAFDDDGTCANDHRFRSPDDESSVSRCPECESPKLSPA